MEVKNNELNINKVDDHDEIGIKKLQKLKLQPLKKDGETLIKFDQ